MLIKDHVILDKLMTGHILHGNLTSEHVLLDMLMADKFT